MMIVRNASFNEISSVYTAGKVAPVLGVAAWTGKTPGVGRRAGVAGGVPGPPPPPPPVLYITGGLLGGKVGLKAPAVAGWKACS